jgi:hypothetical protein
MPVEAIFFAPVQTGPGAQPASCTRGTRSPSWIQSDYRPPPSKAEVKKRVELYLYSPFGPSWPVLRRTEFFIATRLTEGQFLRGKAT